MTLASWSTLEITAPTRSAGTTTCTAARPIPIPSPLELVGVAATTGNTQTILSAGIAGLVAGGIGFLAAFLLLAGMAAVMALTIGGCRCEYQG